MTDRGGNRGGDRVRGQNRGRGRGNTGDSGNERFERGGFRGGRGGERGEFRGGRGGERGDFRGCRGGERGDFRGGRGGERGDFRGDLGGERGDFRGGRGGQRGDFRGSRGGERGDFRGGRSFNRGGDGGNFNSGDNRGGFSSKENRGGFSRGGDGVGLSREDERGGFSRGGNRGGVSRGGNRGGFSRGGDRGGFREVPFTDDNLGGFTEDLRSALDNKESKQEFGAPAPVQQEIGFASDKPSGSVPIKSEMVPSLTPQTTGALAKQKKGNKTKRQEQVVVDTGLSVSTAGMLPNRPDNGGTLGLRFMVGVNCWDFKISDGLVTIYDVDVKNVFMVDGDTRKAIEPKPKQKILREYLEEAFRKQFPPTVFYDSGRILYSLTPLPGITQMGVTKEETATDGKIIQFTIKKDCEVSSSDIYQYVNNPRASTMDMPQVAIKMVDCLIKTINKSVFVDVGRAAVYCREVRQAVPNKLFVIHRGFIVSVRPQWKVRLNIDLVHRAFFPTGNLADILYDKYHESMYEQRQWTNMLRDIRMIRVEASHNVNAQGIPYKRYFTVHGLSPNPADKQMLKEATTNKMISVATYFKSRYNITLAYPNLPCVKVKLNKDDYLPMELCSVPPYQMAKADKGDIASEIIRCSPRNPVDRFWELDKFVKSFSLMQHILAKSHQLQLNAKGVEVEARLLTPPKGQFGDGPATMLGRGKWFPKRYFSTIGQNIKWAIVAIPPDRAAANDMHMVSTELPKEAFRYGVSLDRNVLQKVAVLADLGRLFEEYQKQNVGLIVFILYDFLLYSDIKRFGDLQTGMKTQCIKSATLGKRNSLSNVLLKINAKMGGTNWIVNSLAQDDLVMVLGADVTHPGRVAGEDGGLQKSVASVVASVTRDLMQYAAVITQQATTEINDKANREVIDSMDTIITDLLKTFGNRNNDRLPKRIIYYRDGVSEGQFSIVLQAELTAIQRACRLLQPGYEPGITFIVVQKRHHIRLNPIKPTERNGNVPAGTVVDTEIVHPREFDFFLCSQEGIQGTSKPAHYHVLYDDNDWDSDNLQTFTYALCHAYMRCTRSVSYPAPTYYSHLAAFRARDWLKTCVNGENLINREQRFKVNANQEKLMFFL